jgi:capsular polysaccharide biosynthesis protein
MPETYQTEYGEYTLPISSNYQYIKLITSNDILINTIKEMGYNKDVEDIKKSIKIGTVNNTTDTNKNSFEITVTSDNPVEAQKLAKVLYDKYIQFLNVFIAKGITDYYYKQYTINLKTLDVSLKSTQEILNKNEELLKQTPQTINQKEAMNAIPSDTNDYIVLENVINPNYTELESDIVDNKQSLNDIENSIRVYNEYLSELDAVKDKFTEYDKTGNFNTLQSDITNVAEPFINLSSDPLVPNHKTSPSNLKNAIIGVIIGGMIGVLVSLLKEFGLKKKMQK